METNNRFLGNHCKLVKADGFVLYGIVKEITPMYVLFKTEQRTSMISFIDIRELCLDPRYYKESEL